MIYKKSWIRTTTAGSVSWRYTGWFLFGLIPLYITRERF